MEEQLKQEIENLKKEIEQLKYEKETLELDKSLAETLRKSAEEEKDRYYGFWMNASKSNDRIKECVGAIATLLDAIR